MPPRPSDAQAVLLQSARDGEDRHREALLASPLPHGLRSRRSLIPSPGLLVRSNTGQGARGERSGALPSLPSSFVRGALGRRAAPATAHASAGAQNSPRGVLSAEPEHGSRPRDNSFVIVIGDEDRDESEDVSQDHALVQQQHQQDQELEAAPAAASEHAQFLTGHQPRHRQHQHQHQHQFDHQAQTAPVYSAAAAVAGAAASGASGYGDDDHGAGVGIITTSADGDRASAASAAL